MWTCPKCRSEVEDSFEVCWSCGTSIDGVEDPSFVTADECEPILDEDIAAEPMAEDVFADFGGSPVPDLVNCYMASNTIEAKFIADRLMEQGIPAIAGKIDVNLVMGGFQPRMWGHGPNVWVRTEDLDKARAWLGDYDRRQKERREQSDRSEEELAPVDDELA